MPQPRALKHLQDLARRKHYTPHRISRETGVALSVVQRLLQLETSPIIRNVETLTAFLEKAPRLPPPAAGQKKRGPKPKTKKKKKTAREGAKRR